MPPNSASMALIYSKRRFGVSATGYFISRSDDSTFLTDENYGNTLLLPNRNLLNAYQLLTGAAGSTRTAASRSTPALATFWMNIIKGRSDTPRCPSISVPESNSRLAGKDGNGSRPAEVYGLAKQHRLR